MQDHVFFLFFFLYCFAYLDRKHGHASKLESGRLSSLAILHAHKKVDIDIDIGTVTYLLSKMKNQSSTLIL